MWHRVKNITIFVLVLFVAAGITASVILLNENNQANSRQQQLTTQLQACLAGEDVPTDAPACKYPTAQSCYHQSANGWLVVNLPCDDQAVTPSMQVKGVAFGAFENTLNYELLNSAGNVIDEGYIMVNAPSMGVTGTFDATIDIDPVAFLGINEGNATFQIFMVSARDGSKENLVSIPVKI